MIEIEVGGQVEVVWWMSKVIAIEYVEAVTWNALPNCRKNVPIRPIGSSPFADEYGGG